jgi:U6 snRNA-associated Sm-like protein LSm7
MAGHKPSVIDMERLMDQKIRVKCNGGRELVGILKSYDQIPNIILDECIEHLRSADDPYVLTDQSREIGLLMVRGTSIVSVAPEAGIARISNPFVDE